MARTSAPEPTPVLTDNVLKYLASRNLHPGGSATVNALTDGVSARVYLVEGERSRWVVKQALSELQVDTQWLASPDRVLTEAAALKLAHTYTPNNVPEVVDVDETACAVTMTAAPRSLFNWRHMLMHEKLDQNQFLCVAERLGSVLGTWHNATWGWQNSTQEFSSKATFEQLRLTPFHRNVLGQHPQLSQGLGACIDELESRRECLVHGDFSPKNILVSSKNNEVWVLDFEVAHIGAAVFDAAFLGHHLAMKAILRPEYAARFHDAFGAFLRCYNKEMKFAPNFDLLGWHTAALLLARVDGVSRARYLSPVQAGVVRSVADRALKSPDPSAAVLWQLVLFAAGESAL